jgi:hypothetical protein
MPVAPDKNTDVITVTITMSNATTLTPLPANLGLASSNPDVAVGLLDADLCQIYAWRKVPGPVSTTVTVTLPGLAPVTYEASFAGIPAVVPVSLTLEHNRDGTLP